MKTDKTSLESVMRQLNTRDKTSYSMNPDGSKNYSFRTLRFNIVDPEKEWRNTKEWMVQKQNGSHEIYQYGFICTTSIGASAWGEDIVRTRFVKDEESFRKAVKAILRQADNYTYRKDHKEYLVEEVI